MLCFRNEIFKVNSITNQFVQASLVALKNKFLIEKSTIKRAGIIFLISKIYFTDDIANLLKLRIVQDEWIVFTEYVESIKNKTEYEAVKIMFFHLFTENFFRFTMKNKALALDFGTPEDRTEALVDNCRDATFWSEIRRDLEVIGKSDIVELTQLNNLREKAREPFKDLFPEESMLTEALNEFETIKYALKEPAEVAATAKVSKKEMSRACRSFLSSSSTGQSLSQIEVEEIDWDSDMEDFEPTSTVISEKRKKRREANRRKKTKQAPQKNLSSSDSDSEREFKKMNRTLGYNSQNVMKGLGAGVFSEKLKQCYGHVKMKTEKE